MLRRWVLPAIVIIIAAAIAASVVCFTPVTRDGTSVRRAIILHVPKDDQTFEEWSWIDEHYPNAYALDWMHATMSQKGWLYSRYRLNTTTGPKEVYFDLREREQAVSASNSRVLADAASQDNSDGDAWKRLIDWQTRQQVAGKNPPFDQDWKEYWTNWYSAIRSSTPDRLLGEGSEFKSAEEMVHYIKEKLKEHGLPAYDET